jgi:hypothetical protein
MYSQRCQYHALYHASMCIMNIHAVVGWRRHAGRFFIDPSQDQPASKATPPAARP